MAGKAGVRRFEDLVAWQKARALTSAIYQFTSVGAMSKDFGLREQIRRAAVSVMSNIAEGFERGGQTEFHQFLSMAKASCAEIRSQLYVAFDAGYADEQTFKRLFLQAEEVARIIGGLRAAVQQRRDETRPRKRGAVSRVPRTQHSALSTKVAMATIWDQFKSEHYVGLQPWAWVQLESAEAPGPFPFVGGVAPEVVASLHEAHQLLASAVETVISDVFARRVSLEDPGIRRLVEDAYAEVVQSRPHLSAHIPCGRGADGVFHWDFAKDPTKSATMTYAGLRIFNAAARQAIPLPFDRPMSAPVGKFIGMLDGTRTASELNTVSVTLGRDVARFLGNLLEVLHRHECLTVAATASVRSRWLEGTQDQDVVHLGHAGLLYRQRDRFLAFDPWLMPWFAEAPVPSLWTSLLPRPAAVFLTHDHDDHVDPRTLLHLPKDVPIIVPSRKNRRALFFDYLSLLRELGFSQVVELAHGDRWNFDGGAVVAVPFFGEDPCDLEMPRNCYLIADRGHNVLIHVDSGPTNAGKSAVREGVIDGLVKKYGPIAVLYASQQQLKEVRTYAAHAALSHPGQWLDPGENGFLTNHYLCELAAEAQAKLFVSYATGGADWFPDHLSFMFSRRNPARTALLTAHWERPEQLGDLLVPQGCGYHPSRAFHVVRARAGNVPRVLSVEAILDPMDLYRRDHDAPSFLRPRSSASSERR